MSTIKQVIEESLKGFDEQFDCFPENPTDYVIKKEVIDKIKSHLLTTISNILEAVEAEVIIFKKCGIVFRLERKLKQSKKFIKKFQESAKEGIK